MPKVTPTTGTLSTDIGDVAILLDKMQKNDKYKLLTISLQTYSKRKEDISSYLC